MPGSDPLAWLFNFLHGYDVVITCTSSGKHVPTSWHYKHRAVDVIGQAHELRRIMRDVFEHPAWFLEAFYDPMGRYVKNGTVRLGAIGGHGDHVHLAR